MRSQSSHVVFVLIASLVLVGCHPTPPSVSSNALLPRSAVRDLQRDFERALSSSAGEHAYWGVLARSLKNDETLYALNSHKLMLPASAMKIVTLAAAAERLGWGFTYETQVFAAGPIELGTLNGDLIVVGSGDPSLTENAMPTVFASWAEQLKAAGIRAVNGRIVGDDSAFDDEDLGRGWSWDDLAEGYAAGISALQYNENSVRATITPGPAVGSPAAINLVPDGSGLMITNLVKTAAADSRLSMVARHTGNGRLQMRGAVPLGGGPFARVTVFRNTLVTNGIDVAGPAVALGAISDPHPPVGVPLITYRSPPLASLAVTLMKLSQNLYAETLLKTLGAASGTPTFEGGRAIVRSTLASWQLPADELILVDGSGLSRYGYVTPELLVELLAHLDRDDKLRDSFKASLPIAGRDGTLATRLSGTAAEANARAKTGTMTNVRALAGYVTTRDGEPIAFSVLVNNFETPSEQITRIIDGMVVRLAEFSR
jgi:D-alanyl-D-alanine carboxypeptidase/D-alanyl-D-alanine-endopeptidase (penicillin-binding protein 4)